MKYLLSIYAYVFVHGRYLELTGGSDPEHAIPDQDQWVAKLGDGWLSREMGG